MQGALIGVGLVSFFVGGLAAAPNEDVQVILGRARAEATAGDFSAANADYRSALALADSPGNKSYVMTALAVHGYFVGRASFAEARETLKIAAERQKRESVSAYDAAPILVALAEDDQTLKLWGERAETLGDLVGAWTESEGEESSIVAHFQLAQAEAYNQAAEFERAQATMTRVIAILKKLYGEESLAVRRALQLKDKLSDEAVRGQELKDFRPRDPSRSKPAVLPGQEVTTPKLLSKIEPQYTKKARQARYQGTVLLKVVVGTNGRVEKAEVNAPLGLGLDEKAIEAIQQWKFQPGEKGGSPVAVTANIEVTFHLL